MGTIYSRKQMIKLDGIYDLGGLERLDCEVKAMNGYLIPRSNKKYLEISRENKLIKIRPKSTQKEPVPLGHNYIIEYIGEDNKDHRIFVILNWRDRLKLKYNLQILWIQKMEIKVTFIASVITLILSPIVNDIYYHIKGNIKDNSHLNNNPIEIPYTNPKNIPSGRQNGEPQSAFGNSKSGIINGNNAINDTLPQKESSLSQKSDTTINF